MTPIRVISYLASALLLALFSSINFAFALDSVRVIASQSKEDATHQYFIELLGRALHHGTELGKPPTVKVKQFPSAGHESLYRLMDIGEVDVSWMGSSKERERDLYPVRIPLMRGLLGYRVSIIKRQSKESFNANMRYAMHNGVACQGKYWPDSDILEYNGFSVTRVTSFKTNFKLVDAQRCDYFPRAIFEGPAELEKVRVQYPDLDIFDGTIIYYPYPFYFYTSNENKALAELIERGLITMIDSGEFDNFMEKHPITSHLFPLDKWKTHKFLKLKNPLLSPSSVFSLSKYGYKLHSDDSVLSLSQ